MSFQPPSAKQEQQNRKVLEEVQLQKKKLMLKQQAANVSLNNTPTSSTAPLSPSITPGSSSSSMSPMQTTAALDYQNLNKNQRTAMQHAHANSFANFIPQDSSFGNLILPVLPRFDK
ncbi:SOSS complex subunit C-like [Argiope bruennichi]|uniref:SOSS complex subunit C like protein n=1 Tax=Argiope bruennichi TaxID=94029 RepID=A0A8T0EVK7_ARGBR|nr:SOSS complex subunit C-like [Argiope bruennichi]KAF8781781.1 SOSS complex subunit C like protein [Argiope bruennichi]